jgi:hypothetical protein
MGHGSPTRLPPGLRRPQGSCIRARGTSHDIMFASVNFVKKIISSSYFKLCSMPLASDLSIIKTSILNLQHKYHEPILWRRLYNRLENGISKKYVFL